jgi:predicted adenine nucleotide alpha hydrolase (AANH) superfamily ATPase
LRGEYPDERLIGFFYDPNIHPYSEYYLRLLEVQRSCKMLNIELIEGEYDIDNWLKAVRGLEHEPEKGARCSVCFERRFEVSAKKASELGERSFTSTLLISPKKSIRQLQKSGELIAQMHGIQFIAPDYRKRSGTQEQNIMAREAQLYRQEYCGCLFGLKMQRGEQQRWATELFSPISQQIQPSSIEERIALYERRIELEKIGTRYKIVKRRFLNWRLEYGYLRVKKHPISAHFLPYSTLKRGYTRGRIEYSTTDNVHYMSRDEVIFLTLEMYNKILNLNYQTVEELIFNPPLFKRELMLRGEITNEPYSLNLIAIVKEIPTNGIEIVCKSYIYEDVKAELMEV